MTIWDGLLIVGVVFVVVIGAILWSVRNEHRGTSYDRYLQKKRKGRK